MSFVTEEELFKQIYNSSFITNIVESFMYPTVAYTELKGFFGIPDLVIANLSSIDSSVQILRSFAFEMKLSNWKRALIQAYKYRAFVNFSFVVIDQSKLRPVLKNLDQFVLSNIGLISVNTTGHISLHYYPERTDPYSKSLMLKLKKLVTEESFSPILASRVSLSPSV